MGDPFWCNDSQRKWNLGHAKSATGGQAWSEKAALKMGSGVSHGTSREETTSAVLGRGLKSEAPGCEVTLGVGGTA